MLSGSRQKKRFIIRCCFLGQIAFFSWFFFRGPQGMRIIWQMQRENQQACAQLVALKEEVLFLESEIERWHVNPFYKEKFAREHLQMVKPGEQVYVIGRAC